MSFSENNLDIFTEVLGSKASIPGGGSASALVGAVGASLAAMVGNLTAGKKKYADVNDQAVDLVRRAESLRIKLLHLIDDDAVAFQPLSKAYRIPADDPCRDQVMEQALKDACVVPLDTMRTVAQAIDIHQQMAAIGSTLAISDVGVGVACCKAALQGASLNVFINTQLLKDRTYAQQVDREADELLVVYCAKADEVYDDVLARLRGR